MSVARYQIVIRVKPDGSKRYVVLAIMPNGARTQAAGFGGPVPANAYVNAAINARISVIQSLNRTPIEDYANEKY